MGEASSERLLSVLPVLERVLEFVRRRHHLDQDEFEDFGSFVKLRLAERDGAILRSFRARSSLGTYLTVVVGRLLIDYRRKNWGASRPSARSRRLDPAAVQAAALQAEEPLDPVAMGEDRAAAERIEAALRESVDALPHEDRLLVRLHFIEGLGVAQVARVLGLEAKPLYRRLERVLAALRGRLEGAGVEPQRVASLIGQAEFGVGFGDIPRPDGETSGIRPSKKDVEEKG